MNDIERICAGIKDILSRIAALEAHVRELREATEATVEPKIDPPPKRSTFTVGGEPKYIRVLPHGDPGKELPVGTKADYIRYDGTHRVTKSAEGWWQGDVWHVAFGAFEGTLGIISIPEAKPRDIDTMSIDDCRRELAPTNIPGVLVVPNTPEEQRKLPEGWNFHKLEQGTDGVWMASAWNGGRTARGFARNRDLAEWRLRVACERASK